jgi:putative redox protein
MRDVSVHWAGGKFSQDISIGGHLLHADEEIAAGGGDTGPAPHELLLAALGACTAMTLKMYAERKGWPLKDVQVSLSGSRAEEGYVITRRLKMVGELDAEQRQRLLEIANKCPVHKTLTGTITIQTTADPV